MRKRQEGGVWNVFLFCIFFANVGAKKSHIIFVLEKCFKRIMKFPNAALGWVHDY